MDINSTRLRMTVPIRLPTGTLSAPSIQFLGDAGGNTGLYLQSSAVMGVSSGGTQIATFSPTTLTVSGLISSSTLSVTGLTSSSQLTVSGLTSSNTLSVAGLTNTSQLKVSSNGRTINWMDFGTVGPFATIGGNVAGSVSVTFNAAAPNTSNMVVTANVSAGVGIDQLLVTASGYTTSGFVIFYRNLSASTILNVSFVYTALV
jgi:hypothetical protein